jgi:acetyl-CoA acetyltransferase
MTNSRAAVAGVGYTSFTRRSDRTVLDQALEACEAAIADAGIERSAIDGVSTFMVLGDSVPSQAVATGLALPRQRYVMDLQQGGQSPCYLVGDAARAIAAGDASAVLVFRALNGRSGIRVGSGTFPGPGGQFRYPLGYSAYLMYVAMWAHRFLYETGQDEHSLAAVALAQRRFAVDNPRAVLRDPLDLDDYLAAPYIARPFRAADCTSEVDGACAVLVTSVEQARDLRHPPAVVRSAVWSGGPRPGLDIGDHVLHADYTRNYTHGLRDELFGRAGVTVRDLDVAEIYDCFTSTVLMGLEGLGICERGASGEFVRSGGTALDGVLPTNTNGGLLAEGYLHGMNTVAEAVLQVQGRGGPRQAPRHEVAAVTSGALVDGSAMILSVDR